MDLAIDLHGRYHATAGMKIAHALEPLNLMWLEEPVPPENIDAIAKITQSTTTPICAGESALSGLTSMSGVSCAGVDLLRNTSQSSKTMVYCNSSSLRAAISLPACSRYTYTPLASSRPLWSRPSHCTVCTPA